MKRCSAIFWFLVPGVFVVGLPAWISEPECGPDFSEVQWRLWNEGRALLPLIWKQSSHDTEIFERILGKDESCWKASPDVARYVARIQELADEEDLLGKLGEGYKKEMKHPKPMRPWNVCVRN